MRKLLYILLFIPLLNNAQDNNIIDLEGTNIISTNGRGIIDLGKAYQSAIDSNLLLYFNAQYVVNNSLTYNSTGDTIIYVSNDTVVLDAALNVVIGNSVKFTSPTGGNTYTILDTLGSADSLLLSQNCTGNIGDEFFIGCDGSLDDQSIYGNNGTQSTGAYQPKALWVGTDTARWKFDGSDDYFSIDTIQTINLDSGAISMWIKFGSDLGSGDYIISYADYGSTQHVWGLKLSSKKVQIYVRESGDQTITGGTTLSINTWYHIVAMSNGSNYSIYVNNSSESLTGTNDGDWFGDVTEKDGCVFGALKYGSADVAEYHGEIDEVKMYNKTLTETEITELYTTGKHK